MSRPALADTRATVTRRLRVTGKETPACGSIMSICLHLIYGTPAVTGCVEACALPLSALVSDEWYRSGCRTRSVGGCDLPAAGSQTIDRVARRRNLGRGPQRGTQDLGFMSVAAYLANAR